jgi:hypothetical protein
VPRLESAGVVETFHIDNDSKVGGTRLRTASYAIHIHTSQTWPRLQCKDEMSD